MQKEAERAGIPTALITAIPSVAKSVGVSRIITGGGIPDNLPRALPAGVAAEILLDSWDEPPLFRLLREKGRVPEDDMRRTFNLGVGMILVVAQEHAGEVLERLVPHGPGWVIGRTVHGSGVRFLEHRG